MVALRNLVITFVFFLLSACAHSQLNYNALDLSASLDSLTTKQIIFNLVRTLEDDNAVPSQTSIAVGSATTSNAINPQITLPITKAFQTTNTIAIAAQQTVTNATQITRPTVPLQLGFADSWTQGWTLNPITGPDELRRLRALYRYATGKTGGSTDADREKQFECEYPIQSGSKSYTLAGCTDDNSRGINVVVSADPNFLKLPSCVICMPDGISKVVNKNLKYGFIKNTPFAGSRLLARYGTTELYICGDKSLCNIDGMKAFHEFVLFVAEASGQPTQAGANKNPSIKSLGAPILVAPVQ